MSGFSSFESGNELLLQYSDSETIFRLVRYSHFDSVLPLLMVFLLSLCLLKKAVVHAPALSSAVSL